MAAPAQASPTSGQSTATPPPNRGWELLKNLAATTTLVGAVTTLTGFLSLEGYYDYFGIDTNALDLSPLELAATAVTVIVSIVGNLLGALGRQWWVRVLYALFLVVLVLAANRNRQNKVAHWTIKLLNWINWSSEPPTPLWVILIWFAPVFLAFLTAGRNLGVKAAQKATQSPSRSHLAWKEPTKPHTEPLLKADRECRLIKVAETKDLVFLYAKIQKTFETFTVLRSDLDALVTVDKEDCSSAPP